jgi:two-component system, LytTR family, sensor histidine kinase AlgZ
MHPLLRSRRAYAGYLLAWIPLALVYAYLFAVGGRIAWLESIAVTVPTVFVLSFFCLFPYYSCRALPLGAASIRRAAISHAIPAMFFSGVVLAVTHVVLAGLDRMFPTLRARFGILMPALAAMVFLTYLLSTALHYVFQAIERSKQAEVLSREAQLKALKAQVNPHFLFNSLNSISALTTVDPPRAREMCVRLSDFLRSSLRLGERTSITFGEELALAQTYLNVEQIRFGNRLQLVENIDGACSRCEVPPLVIQPLIENAIKHGVATLVSGGQVVIGAKLAGDKMRVTIENDFDPDAPVTSKSGFGIANVRNRLQARYSASAALDVDVRDNRYRVVLSVPYVKGKESRSA